MDKTKARFLPKPYTQDALAKVVREALDERAANAVGASAGQTAVSR